ncbi:hypothetical protein IMZ29_12745 [Achromobacter sp. GG226]|uniref:hypothetical protein n=1 Tax=Verticiella alkaliphila TaxID=2779529 RepID=UPI001C0DD2CC|nr:hypothetical protein [Verticiella sp. GG226]MBU4611364.1 hypothetical protein [Verticiella sp. GG226]
MRARTRRPRAAGYLLAELAVVLLAATLGAVWFAQQAAEETEDAGARATASLLLTARGRLLGWQVQHLDWLLAEPSAAQPTGITAVSWPVDLPLAAFAGGAVDPVWQARPAYGGELRVRLWRDGVCPGTACRPQAMLYTTEPVRARAAHDYSPMLVGQILLATDGYGAHAPPGTPARLRGALLDVANPQGARAGVVAVTASLDATPFTQFVRHGDGRPVRLRNTLAVDGALSTATGLAFDTAVVPGGACAQEGLHARTAGASLAVCSAGIWFELNRYVVTAMQDGLADGAVLPVSSCPAGMAPFTRVGVQHLDVMVGGGDIDVRGQLAGALSGSGAVSQTGAVSVTGTVTGSLRSTSDSQLRIAQAATESGGRLRLSSVGPAARGYAIVGCRHGTG